MFRSGTDLNFKKLLKKLKFTEQKFGPNVELFSSFTLWNDLKNFRSRVEFLTFGSLSWRLIVYTFNFGQLAIIFNYLLMLLVYNSLTIDMVKHHWSGLLIIIRRIASQNQSLMSIQLLLIQSLMEFIEFLSLYRKLTLIT